MSDVYQPLPLHRLENRIPLSCPKQPPPGRVTIDDSALSVMTDFSRVTACTIELLAPLDQALEIMAKRGVRLLLVCKPDDGEMIGLLTSRDLCGKKPDRILEKSGASRQQLIVADVMTMRPKVEVLLMEEVLRARVGDIIATLKYANRQHALVLDRDPETSKPTVQGMFSLAQIGLQLGLNIDPSRRATTYAELTQAGFVL